ncbi:Hypothetical protein LUCI_1816 [Lucifera butyrica]|uniref:G5 domain-containing protein n=1 Tax=Lucifera butyrica TaxID=1351585 RepID=A0A498R6P4_9FIRM|nr:G5 domain-containing protein [Lucifera butyrica]VBB06580.1 Hypothetical protein LUCI_1816 [Lucifera butyrica]
MSDVLPKKAFRGRKMRMLLIGAVIVASLVATGFVWAHKTVHIVVDGKNLNVSTLYNNPQEVLLQAGVTLGPNDEYRLSTGKLVNGSTIEVDRAAPVTLVYRGETRKVITNKPTVGEAAHALGIPADHIKLVPDENTKVTPNMQIQAIVLTEKTISQEESIPYPVVRQPDSDMEQGQEQVVENGQNGAKTVSIRLKFADGQQVGSEPVEEKIIREAKPQIIKVGTRDTVETSRGEMRFRRVEWMRATAYLPTDGSSEGITASGIPARRGIVAVDPSVIRLGTRLFIPGYGLALAADTGSAITGNRIDLCMENSNEAWSFGHQTVKVYILAD